MFRPFKVTLIELPFFAIKFKIRNNFIFRKVRIKSASHDDESQLERVHVHRRRLSGLFQRPFRRSETLRGLNRKASHSRRFDPGKKQNLVFLKILCNICLLPI